MDTITQVLLGATLGAAAFQHRLGRSAIVIGGLGGLLPDLDLVSSAGGPWTSLVHHRGMTHSLLFAPVVAWPLALLSHRWTHKRVSTPFVGDLRPNGARADAPAHPLPRAAQAEVGVHAQLWFWALVTHPLLDLFTTYGTQLLWPLTNRRFSVDGVSIIDLVYSLPLLAAVVVAWRAGERARRAARAARMALAFTTAYLLAGWVVGSSIEQRALAHWEAEDLDEVRAFPSIGNLAYWRVTARTRAGEVLVDYYGLLGGWDGVEARAPRIDDARVERVLATDEGRILTWFSQGWMTWAWEDGAEGRVLWGEDQRYGSSVDPTRSLMAARVVFREDGETIDAIEWVQDRRADLDMGAELRQIGRGIVGRGGER